MKEIFKKLLTNVITYDILKLPLWRGFFCVQSFQLRENKNGFSVSIKIQEVQPSES